MSVNPYPFDYTTVNDQLHYYSSSYLENCKNCGFVTKITNLVSYIHDKTAEIFKNNCITMYLIFKCM